MDTTIRRIVPALIALAFFGPLGAQKSITVGPGEGFYVGCRYGYDDPADGIEKPYTQGETIELYRINQSGSQVSTVNLGIDTVSFFQSIPETAGFFFRARIDAAVSNPSDTAWVYYAPAQPKDDLPYTAVSPQQIASEWMIKGAGGMYEGRFWCWGDLQDEYLPGRVILSKTFYSGTAATWRFSVDATVGRTVSGWSIEYVCGDERRMLTVAGGAARFDALLPAGVNTVQFVFTKCAVGLSGISITEPGSGRVIYRPASIRVWK